MKYRTLADYYLRTWSVVLASRDGIELSVAKFGGEHPNPRQAARLEAARLNALTHPKPRRRKPGGKKERT